MVVYLTGFMGSGKSTLGRRLAGLANIPFIDLDLEIEKREKKSIAQIFSQSGEEYFRRVEAEILRNIDIEQGAVIATGGGTPCHSGNIEYMNSRGVTVYLKMSPAVLVSRLSVAKEERPLLNGYTGDDLLHYVKKMVREREIYYQKSRIIFDGMNAVAARLLDLIQESATRL